MSDIRGFPTEFPRNLPLHLLWEREIVLYRFCCQVTVRRLLAGVVNRAHAGISQKRTRTEWYELKNINNADETGLYYRALPSRSMVLKDDPRKGIKTSKERLTVLLVCSATGEKLKPMVIGHSLNPRCFRGVDKALLPVTYRSNRKAWMTSELFREWLEHLNMFVDNCSAHPDVQLSNMKLVFLPPNTTSRLQPCDAGIIATLKGLYRKWLLRHILAEMD